MEQLCGSLSDLLEFLSWRGRDLGQQSGSKSRLTKKRADDLDRKRGGHGAERVACVRPPEEDCTKNEPISHWLLCEIQLMQAFSQFSAKRPALRPARSQRIAERLYAFFYPGGLRCPE
jgi:hypothetical protein